MLFVHLLPRINNIEPKNEKEVLDGLDEGEGSENLEQEE
jgi:hypothetical protein